MTGPTRLTFLQQMLSFAQHPYLLLADKALPFWVRLLQVRCWEEGASPGEGLGHYDVCLCVWKEASGLRWLTACKH